MKTPVPDGQPPSPSGRHTKEEKMPKQKTHSGAKKRFKITGSGKLKKQQANMRHNLEHKSPKRKRAFSKDLPVAPANVPMVKKLLGR